MFDGRGLKIYSAIFLNHKPSNTIYTSTINSSLVDADLVQDLSLRHFFPSPTGSSSSPILPPVDDRFTNSPNAHIGLSHTAPARECHCSRPLSSASCPSNPATSSSAEYLRLSRLLNRNRRTQVQLTMANHLEDMSAYPVATTMR